MARRARGELGGDAGGEGSGGGTALKRKRTGDATSGEEPTPWLVVSSALHAAEADAITSELNQDDPSSSVRSTNSVTTDGADNGAPQGSGGDDDEDNGEDDGGGDCLYTGNDAKLESFPKRFFSWRELEEYLHEFGESTFQLFRKRTSVTVAVRNVSITRRIEARKDGGRNFKHPELIPDQWGYYSKTYVCTHGLKNHPRGGGLRTHTSVRDTGCTARIQTTLRFDQNALIYYISARVTGSHNHPVSKEQYFSYAENRRITDPVVLRDIDEMSARGEFPKAILAHIAKRMRETSGEECVYKLKDIRNIISRLKKERKELLGAQAANAVQQQLSTTGANGEVTQQAASAALSALASNASQPTPASAEVSRNLLIAAASDGATANSPSKASLARLELLLDSPYSYRQAHKDIEQVAIAATEMIPKTISGFKHEVVQLSPSTQREDVDFVLPKHALAGCESGIVEYCGAKGLLPQSVGVTLSVTLPNSQEKRVSILSSRQLVTMKRFYLARSSITEAKIAIEWIKATSFSVFPSAPFDEYASYTKDLFVHALKLLPLTRTVIRGKNVDANAQFGFTDAIFGASLLKFSSHANIDVDCVKAALLHMHRRFYAKASFISPSFVFETDVRERCSRASTYGAFLYPKDFVAGLSQLQSQRWGGFFFDCTKKVCYLCAPTESEYEELQATVGALFRGLNVAVDFETSPGRPASTTNSNDSGVLALLFVECMLLNTTWGDNPVESFDYFRVRYLMQAIQVVNKQDVNDISW